MIISTKTQAYDGDLQIVFSDVFNLYNNKLLIKDVAGFNFEFNFTVEKDRVGSSLNIKGDDASKTVKIELCNFNNSLGVGTTIPVKLLNLQNNKEILFSIHCKSLSETTAFLQVGINFYLR